MADLKLRNASKCFVYWSPALEFPEKKEKCFFDFVEDEEVESKDGVGFRVNLPTAGIAIAILSYIYPGCGTSSPNDG
ncbi:hypothetical protein ACL6C3_25580 [Capilliphycus salinus ALCB114379]|uniref:hypothetical protein n=1 Tax=Capilliphycus salinus TaxID=2768948 RepID=UPI0039A4074A